MVSNRPAILITPLQGVYYVRHAHTQCLPISDATNVGFESNYNLIDTNTLDVRLHTLVQQTQY